MNSFQILVLKGLRKSYQILIGTKKSKKPECIQNADLASNIIFETLIADKPCMIGRFGANELLCLITYLGVKENKRNIFSYISGKSPGWWWNEQNLINMNINAGFFPPTIDKFEQFCRLMLEDIPQVDILGSWLADETDFDNLMLNVTNVRLMYLDPFWSNIPWTRALKDKKILVVHPFAKTIKNQYKKREFLFKDKYFIPEFKSLSIIKAVQSNANENTPFNDWFQALDYMKAEIDKVDYDICLIGCGAYGFPLAAHVKRSGKKAFHIGGSLQLLFGIRGKRWESVIDPHYEPGSDILIDYHGLPNDHWVRPSEEETPKNHFKVEGSCYW